MTVGMLILRLTELVERQSQQIQQLIQRGERGEHQRAEFIQPQQRAKHFEAVGERFRKLNPPIFEDALDPTAVEDWLRTLENMFRYTRVSEVEKVECASFMLRAPVRAMKMNEFIQLRQGGMTVGEYIRKFEQLSRFPTHMINTDALKVERFLEGLRPELYRDVIMVGIQDVSYSQIAERALVAEQAEQRISRAQEARRQFRQGQGQRWPRNDKKRTFQGQIQKPKFQPREGQQHWDQGKRLRIDQGKALIAQPSCPRCGNPNHPIEQKKVPARVFTITRSDAEANPSVVTGKFYIFCIPALVLLDSGATHSFVSTEYVRRLGRTPDIHELSYSVTIPPGDVQQTNLIVRACTILTENREFYANLIVLDMKDYDIILGMDWLSRYQATIDCKRKSVTFQFLGIKPFTCIGIEKGFRVPIISVLKAQRLLDRGCVGYLVSIMAMEAQHNPNLKNFQRYFLMIYLGYH
ncbi:uncharacterized protein LOC111390021 [Olea europaea var. sylvestris]|uniref:uncharacterized protein LOC111390021 n=1 Tax=Olea europaea var. sylvestris TaxID=158386 RepID=UPI000C1CF101|nr:uncharacterized protein LOC111390021 [Olea europaea var. sylvestris]